MNFVKVKSIKKLDNNFISYDLTTKRNHNFFANNILVHNSNFSFMYDGKTLDQCGRKKILGLDEDYYYYQEDLKHIPDKIVALLDFLKVNSIQVYGEYAGVKIQKGVQYGDRDFYVFDIKVNSKIYLDFSRVLELCKAFNLKTVPVLFRGTFQECLAYPNDNDSAILGIEDNIYEGTVIRPNETFFFGTTRVIVKNKNKKFSDKNNKKKKPKVAHVYTEEQLEFLTYINDNRVNDVISKDPETCRNFGKLLGLVIKDVLEDFPCKTDKFMSKAVAELVRPAYLEHIENMLEF